MQKLQTDNIVQVAVLVERVNNLIQKFEEYAESNERRHQDAEKALAAHIAHTLPIIDSYQQFQGEWKASKAGLWLIALILAALVSSSIMEIVKH